MLYYSNPKKGKTLTTGCLFSNWKTWQDFVHFLRCKFHFYYSNQYTFAPPLTGPTPLTPSATFPTPKLTLSRQGTPWESRRESRSLLLIRVYMYERISGVNNLQPEQEFFWNSKCFNCSEMLWTLSNRWNLIQVRLYQKCRIVQHYIYLSPRTKRIQSSRVFIIFFIP